MVASFSTFWLHSFWVCPSLVSLFVSQPFCRRRLSIVIMSLMLSRHVDCTLRLRCLTTKSRSSSSFWKRKGVIIHRLHIHCFGNWISQSCKTESPSLPVLISLICRKRSIHHWQTHLTFPFFHPSIIHFDPWSLSCHCLLDWSHERGDGSLVSISSITIKRVLSSSSASVTAWVTV